MTRPPLMNRREALGALSSVLSAGAMAIANERPGFARSKVDLGLVVYTQGIQRRLMKAGNPKQDLFEPSSFLDRCFELGAGGMQVPLGVLEPEACERLRETADARGMFIEGIVGLPYSDNDSDRFRAEIETAALTGVPVVRTVIIPGRRYERFRTRGQFEEYVLRGKQALSRAKPIVEHAQVRLAVENHKDQRLDERLELLKAIDSPFIGACVDTGNSLALLEEPETVVKALAPYAYSVHLKDQAVRECRDGFLLADAALGDGFLNLQSLVDVLRRARPEIRFSLETITRDALLIPCLTEDYWITMPNVPACDLARMLSLVRSHDSEELLSISSLPLATQATIEERIVKKSLEYSHAQLQM